MLKVDRVARKKDLTVIRSYRVKGVVVERIYVRDRYDGARFWVSRLLTRGSLTAMRLYLAWRPHYAFDDPRNLARKVAYAVPGIRAWAPYMPSGFATHYVFRPEGSHFENGKRMDIITKWLFRYSLDGRGVRTRARLLERWTAAQMMTMDHASWLSIAAGSGLATYETVQTIKPPSTTVELVLAEIDPSMLAFARSVRRRYHARLAHTTFVRADATKARDLARIIRNTHPDVIECIGICEYLPDKMFVTFLHRMYRLLPPGATIIFSNMSPTHPELDLHHRTTGWPGVIVRDIEQVIHLVEAAQIPLAALRVSMADDQVYGMYRVEKLLS